MKSKNKEDKSMFTSKQKFVAATTTLALGWGVTAGITPALAHSDVSPSNDTSIYCLVKEDRLPFTGYVISISHGHMLVADTPTREEALFYLGSWWVLAFQDKLLKVPISNPAPYMIGEKVKVFARAMTNSIPALAIVPKIERIQE